VGNAFISFVPEYSCSLPSVLERGVTTQPKLSVDNGPAAPDDPPTPAAQNSTVIDSPASNTRQSGSQVWLHRTSIFLFVLVSAVAGVLLVILPWTPEWTDNYLLLSFPWLRTLFTNGFFRGLCSGLGLLDIWIGFWEALHYHDRL
jgi:hypothetical protein